MKKPNTSVSRAVTAALAGAAISVFTLSCSVDQTEEGEMPEVEVEGGNLPEYDVDAAEVDVSMEEKTVTVPDVDVTMPDDEPDEVIIDEPVLDDPIEPTDEPEGTDNLIVPDEIDESDPLIDEPAETDANN